MFIFKIHSDKILFLRIVLTFFCMCIAGLFDGRSVLAAQEARAVKEANKLYFQGEFDQALELYHEALLKDNESPLLNFNTGAAHYKKNDYEKAKALFSKALISPNRIFESKAAYNIGNVLFRQAKAKEQDDLSGAVELLNESLAYYQRAMELNQKDEDPKYNYEVADRELKKLQERLAQSQKDQQKEAQEEQREQQEQKQQAESQESKESKEEQQKEGEEQKSGEEKESQLQQGEQASQKESEKKGLRTSAVETDQMTQEEAKMLIDAYAREGLRLNMFDRHEPQEEQGVEKDW